MKSILHLRQAPSTNYVPLPNETFSLGLSAGEIAVYAYLLYCEDRKTYQCWPSYKSIGKAVKMSVNTVRKYITMLEEKGLLLTEPTSIITKDGAKHNGNLLYTICPIQNAVDLFHERQMCQLDAQAERRQVEKALAVQQANQERPA